MLFIDKKFIESINENSFIDTPLHYKKNIYIYIYIIKDNTN